MSGQSHHHSASDSRDHQANPMLGLDSRTPDQRLTQKDANEVWKHDYSTSIWDRAGRLIKKRKSPTVKIGDTPEDGFSSEAWSTEDARLFAQRLQARADEQSKSSLGSGTTADRGDTVAQGRTTNDSSSRDDLDIRYEVDLSFATRTQPSDSASSEHKNVKSILKKPV